MIKQYQEELSLDKINSMVLISSESCNLNCKYCEIAKAVNKETHKKVVSELKQNYLNGTFLKNLKKTFKEYNIDPLNIKNIDLWGQEPTLTLNEVSSFFPQLYQLTPNCKHLFFSTNGVSFYDRIINFILMLEENVKEDFTLSIQVSYDGYEETKNLRGVNPEIIIKNINSLILELNKIKLSKVRVEINFHNVISIELMKRLLKDEEKFVNYWEELNKLAESWYFLGNNEKVIINHMFSSGLITPYNGTQEEGILLSNFMNKCENFNYEGTNKYITEQFLNITDEYQEINNKGFTLEQIINKIINFDKDIDDEFLDILGHLTTCGYGKYTLKIRYDGTLVHCQNAIFGLGDPEILNDIKNNKYQIQKYLIEYGAYPNIFKNEKDKIKKLLYRVDNSYSGFIFEFAQILNLMFLLREVDQIDPSYKNDYNKMLNHAFLLTTIFSCPDGKVMETGSFFGRQAGQIRFFCNGFMDLIVKKYNERLQGDVFTTIWK